MYFVVVRTEVMEARDVSRWPDADLVASIAGQTAEARAAERSLCERYSKPILLYGVRHLRDEDRARELVQEVLVVVLEAARAGKIEEPARLASFVLGTCRFVVWDLRRDERRRVEVAEHAAVGEPESAAPAWHGVDLPRLGRCMGRLATRELTVIRLSFHEDLSSEEVARVLAVAPGNVRVIRHRALQRLTACLEGGRGDATWA